MAQSETRCLRGKLCENKQLDELRGKPYAFLPSVYAFYRGGFYRGVYLQGEFIYRGVLYSGVLYSGGLYQCTLFI